uniref:Secreted protein n=1 Tax=Calcidiscus leptoporus TaxID=127549 RepID=A0A7S0J5K1_9EUKA
MIYQLVLAIVWCICAAGGRCERAGGGAYVCAVRACQEGAWYDSPLPSQAWLRPPMRLLTHLELFEPHLPRVFIFDLASCHCPRARLLCVPSCVDRCKERAVPVGDFRCGRARFEGGSRLEEAVSLLFG